MLCSDRAENDVGEAATVPLRVLRELDETFDVSHARPDALQNIERSLLVIFLYIAL